jgi:hypothetical protein
LACLFVDGPVAKEKDREEKLQLASAVMTQLLPVFSH